MIGIVEMLGINISNKYIDGIFLFIVFELIRNIPVVLFVRGGASLTTELQSSR